MGSRVFIKKDGVQNHRKFMKIPALLLLAERQSGKIQNDYVIILNYPALDFPHLQDNKVGFSKKKHCRSLPHILKHIPPILVSGLQ